MKSLTSLTPNLDLVSAFIKPEYAPDLTTTVGKLKHLRWVVERIDPAEFDMHFVTSRGHCGTTGCMLGHAGMSKTFASIGLSYGPLEHHGSEYCLSNGMMVSALNYRQVGARTFGIPERDSYEIFTSDIHWDETGPLTISHGLARIDRMIEKYSGQ